MSISKKDFEAVAAVIQTSQYAVPKSPSAISAMELDAHNNACLGIAIRLANVFEEANPRFNRERFLVACGVKALRS